MVCFLTGYASCAASASLPAWLAHLLSAVSAASACERTALNCNKTSVFSRVQARSAPRAHVRELLCVPQSSKERLRRSRTESSGAAPAIEELAGEARQVRPAGPRAEKLAARLGLLAGEEVWRAPGPPAPTSNIFSQKISLPPPQPTTHSRSRKFPSRYRPRPFEEVWRAPGPPAPTTVVSSRKISLPPQSRPHAAGGKRKKAPHRKFRCDAFDSMGGNASETFPGMNG